MTLIITAVNPDYAIQVSDRRLSSGGPHREEMTKETFFACRDAGVSIAFSGLAKAGAFGADRWIADALQDCAPPDHLLGPTLERVRQRLSEEVRQIRVHDPRDRALSYHVAGFLAHADPHLGYAAVISNVDHRPGENDPDETPSDDFTLWDVTEVRPAVKPATLLIFGGMRGAVEPRDSEELVKGLRERIPAGAFVDRASAIVRRVARRPAARGLVGSDCMSIVIRPGAEMADVAYHGAKGTTTISYTPNYVRSRGDGLGDMTIMGVETLVTDALGNPAAQRTKKIGRNERCPCGSGLKYKKCHLGKPLPPGTMIVLGPHPDPTPPA